MIENHQERENSLKNSRDKRASKKDFEISKAIMSERMKHLEENISQEKDFGLSMGFNKREKLSVVMIANILSFLEDDAINASFSNRSWRNAFIHNTPSWKISSKLFARIIQNSVHTYEHGYHHTFLAKITCSFKITLDLFYKKEIQREKAELHRKLSEHGLPAYVKTKHYTAIRTNTNETDIMERSAARDLPWKSDIHLPLKFFIHKFPYIFTEIFFGHEYFKANKNVFERQLISCVENLREMGFVDIAIKHYSHWKNYYHILNYNTVCALSNIIGKN